MKLLYVENTAPTLILNCLLLSFSCCAIEFELPSWLLNFLVYGTCVFLQPRDVLCGAADEVLIVLKNDRMKDKDKKREVETLLGDIADERFALLVNLGKKISDWGQEEKMQTGNI